KRRVKKNWTLRHHSPAPAPRYRSARAREKRKRRKAPRTMRGDFRPIENTLLPSNQSRGVPFQTKSTEWAGQRKTCLLRHLVVTQVCHDGVYGIHSRFRRQLACIAGTTAVRIRHD